MACCHSVVLLSKDFHSATQQIQWLLDIAAPSAMTVPLCSAANSWRRGGTDAAALRNPMSRILTDDDRITLERELQVLEQEHRDLDAAIYALGQLALPDQLQIQRLKRKKLALKDKIVQVHGMLTPDIIA